MVAATTTPRAKTAAPDDLILDSIADTALRYGFTEPQVRDLVWHAQARLSAQGDPIAPNGLAEAIIRVNGRVLIDRIRMRQWLESHRGLPSAPNPSTRHQQQKRNPARARDVRRLERRA